MPRIDIEPKVINHFLSPDRTFPILPIVTGNTKKIEEYKEAGLPVQMADIQVQEIQNRDPIIVVMQKAKDAWRINKGPVVVEDTSFEVDQLGGLPGPYTKDFLGEKEQRATLCRTLSALYPNDSRGATFRVLLALYDGREVQIREGLTRGIVADKPTGAPFFAFDDIFTPQEELGASQVEERDARTYAQMSLAEKNKTSPRMRAIQALIEDPFKVGNHIYELQEPHPAQVALIQKEILAQNPTALRFAYDTEATKHMKPHLDFKLGEFLPFHRIEHNGGAVLEFKIDPDSASQGLVILPQIDLKRDAYGQPVRLDVDIAGDPVLLQMGPDQVKMALAARALEFAEMHSDKMHDHIRALRDGKIETVPRTNTRSVVLEEMLGWKEDERTGRKHATKAIATSDIAYDRVASLNDTRSRRESSQTGLFINTKYGPLSVLGLGGMPPTGGSKDTLVLSALDYAQCWVPRNGVFAGDFDRQLKLFRESKEQIESYDLPKDIEELCISRIGLTVGCENPETIAKQVAQYQKAGGKSVRIYTTNADSRILDTAIAIRNEVDNDTFMIAVGPVTDAEQARALRDKADVGMFIIGHGAGENCTSLEGGGSANAIGILYDLYLDTDFNDRLLFLEGGVGQNYGPLLGLADGFFMNKKAIGGIESTAGLYATHIDSAKPCIPYPGSASPGTQLVEAYMNEDIAKKRLNPAGKLVTNEGKPNYVYKPDYVTSNVDPLRTQREFIGRAVGDRGGNTVYDIHKNIAKYGHNIVNVSSGAAQAAHSHRARPS